MMNCCRLDANVLLRFLRDDDVVQSVQARTLLASAQKGEVNLAASVLTMAEVFYALRASYGFSRSEAAELLTRVLRTDVIDVERAETVANALERVQHANVDFGDAMLAAEAAATRDEVATFDRDFERFPDVKRYAWV